MKQKLYEVTVLDDCEEVRFLKVSNKTQEEVLKEVENEKWSCFMTATVLEIRSVGGYDIILRKNKKNIKSDFKYK